MKEFTVAVSGMMCQKCESHVVEAVKEIKGVKSVTASKDEKKAVVVAKDSVKAEEIKAAITEAGYEVGDITEKVVEKQGFFARFKK